MSCYHPLLAVDLGEKVNGKKDIRILKNSGGVAAPEYISALKETYGSRLFPFVIQNERKLLSPSQFLTLPCGRCIGCQLAKSREWAARCMLEMKYHDSAYFITLTYSDEHLTYGGMVNDVVPSPTLVKRDLQLFMKRLRKRFPDQRIRFFACGEYGPVNLRPHYHLILFGLKFPDGDLEFWKLSKAKVAGTYSKIYSSKVISELWPFGLNGVGDVTFESVAYVARYTVKKLEHALAEDIGVAPEFIVMSRRPGIAYEYFEEHKGEIYTYDEILVDKGGKPFKAKPSRYYDRLFDLDDHDTLAAVKKRRKEVAEAVSTSEYAKTDKSITEYIETKESIKTNSAAKLRRIL